MGLCKLPKAGLPQVYHIESQVWVPRAPSHPRQLYCTTVVGCVNLDRCIKMKQCTRFDVISPQPVVEIAEPTLPLRIYDVHHEKHLLSVLGAFASLQR